MAKVTHKSTHIRALLPLFFEYRAQYRTMRAIVALTGAHMTQHTVAKAATLVGITRSTLFRHIREGRVSSTISKDGVKMLDTAELIRVYGELQPVQKTHSSASDKPTLAKALGDSAVTIAVLEAQLEAARAQLEEGKQREAKYLEMIAAQTLKLLEAKKSEAVKRSWLNFFV